MGTNPEVLHVPPEAPMDGHGPDGSHVPSDNAEQDGPAENFGHQAEAGSQGDAPPSTSHDGSPREEEMVSHPSPAEETSQGRDVAEEVAAELPAAKDVGQPAAEPQSKAAKSRKAAIVVPEPAAEVPKSENMNWYILKVQSNREESIREGLLRRVSIQGLDRFFGEVIVPTEKVTEFKGGKKRVIKRKLYPGYIVVHMEINEDTWFLVRETPGIGDFTGASGKPSEMLPHEVDRIIAKQEEKSEKAPDLKIPFAKGDRVKVVEGNFENFEGEVDAIDKTNGRVTVMITIFNRTTPVEFEYWQVESV
jgi:transcription termination/antitermination protein NusG